MGQQFTKAAWEVHHDELRHLYLVEDKTLAEVMKHMEEKYNLRATKNQYEQIFRDWNFRKNLTQADWEFVDRRTRKRKASNIEAESAVYLNGFLLPPKKVKKEISRHVLPSYAQPYAAVPSPDTPPGISVRTPGAPGNPVTPGTPRNYGAVMSPQDVARFVIRLDGLPSARFQQLLARCGAGNWNSSVLRLFHSQRDFASLGHISLASIMAPTHTTTPSRVLQSSMLPQLLPNDGNQPPVDLTSLDTIASAIHEQISTVWVDDGSTNLESTLQVLVGARQGDSLSEFIRFASYLSSNNMFSKNQSDDLLRWVCSTKNISALEKFCCIRLSTVATFARCLFDSAVRSGEYDAIRALIRSGVNPSIPIKGYDGCPGVTPLVHAVQTKDFQLFHLLIQTPGLDINYRLKDESGWFYTALHVAASLGRGDFVRSLVEHGASVDWISREHNRTVSLMEASLDCIEFEQFLNTNIIKLFLNAGANVVAPTRINPIRTALQSAALAGNLRLVQFLLDAGANINAPAASPLPRGSAFNATLLQHTSFQFDWDVEQYDQIGEEGSDQGEDEAILENGAHCTIAKWFLDAGVDVNAAAVWDPVLAKLSSERFNDQDEEYFGATALQGGVRSGDLELVRILLDAGAEVNAPACLYGRGGGTAIQLAASGTLPAHLDILRLLLEHGADVNAPSAPHRCGGKTALEAAVACWAIDSITALIEAGADINPSNRVLPPLSRAARIHDSMTNARDNIVSLLIRYGADINIAVDPEIGMTPLVAAIWCRNFELAKSLLMSGADVNAPGKMSALEAALSVDAHDDLIQMIRSCGGLVTFNDFSVSSELLDHAVESKRMTAVQELLGMGIQVNHVHRAMDDGANDWISNPLPRAIMLSDFEIFDALVQAGANINASCIFNIGEEDEECCSYIRNKTGWDLLSLTPLIAATLKSSMNRVVAALSAGADVNLRPSPFGGPTALQIAAGEGNIPIVEFLLNNGADINAEASPDGGRTALQAAIIKGHMKIVDILLDQGADVHAAPAESNGVTAFQAAVIKGYFPLARKFLEMGADPNEPPAKLGGHSAMEFAAMHGRLDMLHLLLNAGADVGGDFPKRAKELAFDNGHYAIADLLAEKFAV